MKIIYKFAMLILLPIILVSVFQIYSYDAEYRKNHEKINGLISQGLISEMQGNNLIVDYSHEKKVSFFIVFVTLLIYVGVILFLNQNIVKPIVDLRKDVDEIMSGNLNVQIDYVERDDEIGSLASDFKKMLSMLRLYVGKKIETVIKVRKR